MFPFGKKSKYYWRNRYAYDNTATYKDRDSVWYTVGGVTYWYGYQGRNTITGVTPDTVDMGWVRLGDITETPVRGLQGIPGPIGPEPTDARLNALISLLVLEPSNARLNTLINAIISTLDLQNETEVNTLIQDYLQGNEYRTDAQIRGILNEAYANVLAELGAVQVEYADNPAGESDWSPTNTLYDRFRIRLNNPDAAWHVIVIGDTIGRSGITPAEAENLIRMLVADWAEEGNTDRIPDAKLPESVSEQEAETGTATTIRSWTAHRVRQAINAVVSTWARVGNTDKIPDAKLPTEVTQGEAEGGTSTDFASWTAQRVRQAANAAIRLLVSAWALVGNPDKIPQSKLPDIVSQTDAEAGTSTDAYLWTPERISEAIAALATVVGGGLNQAEVDMRIRALISDWAEDGNTDRIPEAKLPEHITEQEAETGTATTIRSWTAHRVRQAIEAVVSIWARDGNTDKIPDAKLPTEVTQGEAEGGTSTDLSSWTAQRVRQAINAVVSAWARIGNTDKIPDAKLPDVVSQTDAETGTSTDTFSWTPERIAQAIAALQQLQSGLTQAQVDARVRALVADWAEEANTDKVPEPKLPDHVTEQEAETGTSTTIRSWTSHRVRQAIEAVVSIWARDGSPDKIPDAKLPTEVTQGEAEGGTSTDFASWTAQRVRQAINAVVAIWAREGNTDDIPLSKLPDVVSQTDAEAGTSTDAYLWTAERVNQAIQALQQLQSGLSQPQVDARINALIDDWAKVGNTDDVPLAKLPDVVDQTEAEARTSTEPRLWTAQRVGQAIASGITAAVTAAINSIVSAWARIGNTDKVPEAKLPDAVTEQEAEGGTATTIRSWTALRVRQAIDTVVSVWARDGNTDKIPEPKLPDEVTQGEAETGTSTTITSWTAQRVRHAIDAVIATWARMGNTDKIPVSKLPDIVTQIAAEAGTSTDPFLWTPERVNQAIQALATMSQGGGLTQAQVDARIQALVADWAEDGNTDKVPEAKLPDHVSEQEAETGTATTIRSWTAHRVRQAINAVVPNWGRDGNTDRIPNNKLPAEVSQSEAEDGTHTDIVSWTAQRVRQAANAAINALVSAWARIGNTDQIPPDKIPVEDWAKSGNTDDLPESKLPFLSALWARIGNTDRIPSNKIPHSINQNIREFLTPKRYDDIQGFPSFVAYDIFQAPNLADNVQLCQLEFYDNTGTLIANSETDLNSSSRGVLELADIQAAIQTLRIADTGLTGRIEARLKIIYPQPIGSPSGSIASPMNRHDVDSDAGAYVLVAYSETDGHIDWASYNEFGQPESLALGGTITFRTAMTDIRIHIVHCRLFSGTSRAMIGDDNNFPRVTYSDTMFDMNTSQFDYRASDADYTRFLDNDLEQSVVYGWSQYKLTGDQYAVFEVFANEYINARSDDTFTSIQQTTGGTEVLLQNSAFQRCILVHTGNTVTTEQQDTFISGIVGRRGEEDTLIGRLFAVGSPAASGTSANLPATASEAEADAGTETGLRSWTPALVRRAINAVVSAWARIGNTDKIPDAKLPDVVSQTDAETGTSTDTFSWTPERIAQAIVALAMSGLTQAQVDARVRALVADWAEEGNASSVPGSKLPDVVSQTEAETGTATVSRLWTAARVAQAIAALAPAGLTQAEVDARVQSLVADWAEDGNTTDDVPLSKLPDVITQTEAEAGTSTTARLWTAERVNEAIQALAPSGMGGGLTQAQVDARIQALVDLWAQVASGDRIPDNKLPVAVTRAEAEAGMVQTFFSWSALRVRQAINAVVPSWAREGNTDDIPASKLPDVVTQADAEAGTSTDTYSWTPERVAQAIAALASLQGGGLTQAQVDARVRALVSDWAEDGDTSDVPLSKLPDTVSQSDAEAGSSTDVYSWTPERVNQAIQALQQVQSGLNQAQVDARVRALVDDWAEQGNTSAIPHSKLPGLVSQTEAETGTATTVRSWTAQRVRQAINAVVPSWARDGNTDNVPDAKLPDVVSQTEAETGTATDVRSWTAERVGQAIAALGGGIGSILNRFSAGSGIDLTGMATTADPLQIAVEQAILDTINENSQRGGGVQFDATLELVGSQIDSDHLFGTNQHSNISSISVADNRLFALDTTGQVAEGGNNYTIQSVTDGAWGLHVTENGHKLFRAHGIGNVAIENLFINTQTSTAIGNGAIDNHTGIDMGGEGNLVVIATRVDADTLRLSAYTITDTRDDTTWTAAGHSDIPLTAINTALSNDGFLHLTDVSTDDPRGVRGIAVRGNVVEIALTQLTKGGSSTHDLILNADIGGTPTARTFTLQTDIEHQVPGIFYISGLGVIDDGYYIANVRSIHEYRFVEQDLTVEIQYGSAATEASAHDPPVQSGDNFWRVIISGEAGVWQRFTDPVTFTTAQQNLIKQYVESWSSSSDVDTNPLVAKSELDSAIAGVDTGGGETDRLKVLTVNERSDEPITLRGATDNEVLDMASDLDLSSTGQIFFDVFIEDDNRVRFQSKFDGVSLDAFTGVPLASNIAYRNPTSSSADFTIGGVYLLDTDGTALGNLSDTNTTVTIAAGATHTQSITGQSVTGTITLNKGESFSIHYRSQSTTDMESAEVIPRLTALSAFEIHFNVTYQHVFTNADALWVGPRGELYHINENGDLRLLVDENGNIVEQNGLHIAAVHNQSNFRLSTSDTSRDFEFPSILAENVLEIIYNFIQRGMLVIDITIEVTATLDAADSTDLTTQFYDDDGNTAIGAAVTTTLTTTTATVHQHKITLPSTADDVSVRFTRSSSTANIECTGFEVFVETIPVIGTSQIEDGAVTKPKVATGTPNTIAGWDSTGAFAEITVDTDPSLRRDLHQVIRPRGISYGDDDTQEWYYINTYQSYNAAEGVNLCGLRFVRTDNDTDLDTAPTIFQSNDRGVLDLENVINAGENLRGGYNGSIRVELERLYVQGDHNDLFSSDTYFEVDANDDRAIVATIDAADNISVPALGRNGIPMIEVPGTSDTIYRLRNITSQRSFFVFFTGIIIAGLSSAKIEVGDSNNYPKVRIDPGNILYDFNGQAVDWSPNIPDAELQQEFYVGYGIKDSGSQRQILGIFNRQERSWLRPESQPSWTSLTQITLRHCRMGALLFAKDPHGDFDDYIDDIVGRPWEYNRLTGMFMSPSKDVSDHIEHGDGLTEEVNGINRNVWVTNPISRTGKELVDSLEADNHSHRTAYTLLWQDGANRRPTAAWEWDDEFVLLDIDGLLSTGSDVSALNLDYVRGCQNSANYYIGIFNNNRVGVVPNTFAHLDNIDAPFGNTRIVDMAIDPADETELIAVTADNLGDFLRIWSVEVSDVVGTGTFFPQGNTTISLQTISDHLRNYGFNAQSFAHESEVSSNVYNTSYAVACDKHGSHVYVAFTGLLAGSDSQSVVIRFTQTGSGTGASFTLDTSYAQVYENLTEDIIGIAVRENSHTIFIHFSADTYYTGGVPSTKLRDMPQVLTPNDRYRPVIVNPEGFGYTLGKREEESSWLGLNQTHLFTPQRGITPAHQHKHLLQFNTTAFNSRNGGEDHDFFITGTYPSFVVDHMDDYTELSPGDAQILELPPDDYLLQLTVHQHTTTGSGRRTGIIGYEIIDGTDPILDADVTGEVFPSVAAGIPSYVYRMIVPISINSTGYYYFLWADSLNTGTSNLAYYLSIRRPSS